MASPDNPFTLVFSGLWIAAMRHPIIADLKVRNKIRFDSETDRDPIKQSVQVADLPELMLTSTGISANLFDTSSSSKCTRTYNWIINTGDFRINELLHQVEWALFCAMHAWKREITSLEWNGKQFVKRLMLTSGSNGQSDSERNRGIKGWSAQWSVEVDFHFNLVDIMNELTSSSSGV